MNSERWSHGAYIRARRQALGLSQPGLARAARITPAMINRLESGQRRGRPPLLRTLADALQVPQSELLERAGYVAEAGYWREQEAGIEQEDPVSRFRAAVHQLPCRPAVQAALLTVVTELARDREQELRERFDQAVARQPGDAKSVSALRTLIFEPASMPAPERA
jgi:transcriptional regulator with XRE-family HTH domain